MLVAKEAIRPLSFDVRESCEPGRERELEPRDAAGEASRDMRPRGATGIAPDAGLGLHCREG